ncbi:SMC-Scp complex subunit ScpB [Patescibacteria group bacterium]|nr:SMC-Scp complex subunit ScpB [Patescibacteria group bacterium]MBU1895689.1 SMC-Scp complex subunit ScpB [Patescibacteria group bacterium]
MDLIGKIESILFVASKPLSTKQLSNAVGVGIEKIEEALETLIMKFNRTESGLHIFYNNGSVQMGTNPDNSEVIEGFVKNEAGGELTKAQLETLTVVAYRGPITRPELEEIRGVNCAVILRNLLIKGLIDENNDEEKLAIVYSISFDALSHIGVTSVHDLPDYDKLSQHENLNIVLKSE